MPEFERKRAPEVVCRYVDGKRAKRQTSEIIADPADGRDECGNERTAMPRLNFKPCKSRDIFKREGQRRGFPRSKRSGHEGTCGRSTSFIARWVLRRLAIQHRRSTPP
jgi:hypothetical protein